MKLIFVIVIVTVSLSLLSAVNTFSEKRQAALNEVTRQLQ